MDAADLAGILFDAWDEERCENPHFDPIVGPSEWLSIAERALAEMEK